MHPTDTKHQFITLRARGLALGKISEQLDVPKSTLGRWQSESEEEIQQLQRIEWEEIEAQYGYTLQDDLRRIMKRMRAAEDQLDARSLERFTRRELLQLIRESRREYERKRALLLGTPKRDKMVRPPTSHSEPESSLNAQPPTFNQTKNPSEIQPFPNQDKGGGTSAASHDHPIPDHSASSPPDIKTAATTSQPSDMDTGENSVAGRFISALHRLQACEADSSQGESDATSTQSQIPNPKSEIESTTPAYSENPAKTLPFPGQNSEAHNPALSSSPMPEVERVVPNTSPGLANSAAESKIENPNSKIPWSRIPARNSESKISDQPQLNHDSPVDDFGGESIPISPFESTREWLERQGIQVSKIPKGARIITTG